MVKVENKGTLKRLTKRFMSINKGRNIIAIIAIVLTATLFTAIMTAASSMIESNRDSEIRQSMSSSHATIQDLTADEYLKVISVVEQYDKIAEYGTDILLGTVMDERLDFQAEARSADENAAKAFLSLPTTGRLPAEGNEFACSTLILDALGLNRELGQEVTLTIENPDNQSTDTTFQLVGFWKGDEVALSQELYVSNSYANSILYPVTSTELDNGILNGSYGISVWFNNTWDIQGKTDQLNLLANLNKDIALFRSNPAYLIFEEDGFAFSSFFLLIAIVFFAGYLIVYNVFQISVNVDIQTYGLLKNIGITGKQLKKIVRMQAVRLSIIGIPVGILSGYIAGRAMVPSLVSDIESPGNAVVTISTNPPIFVIAALLTLITVFTACIIPCRIVQKVTPIEALKVTESSMKTKQRKKYTNINSISMALANVKRSWKKGVIVMASIALSLITLNSVIILVNGFDFKKYANTFISSDFEISQKTANCSSSNLQCITPEIRDIINSCKDSDMNGYIYYSRLKHKMDDILYENCMTLYDQASQDMHEELLSAWNDNFENRTMTSHVMGINEGLFHKLFKSKTLSWDDFKSGQYVIVDYPDYDYDAYYYSAGDKLSVTYDTEFKKEYTVLGEASIPYSLDYPFYDKPYITIIVPESEYLQYSENQNAMCAAIDSKEGKEKEKEVGSFIVDNLAEINDKLIIDSILDLREAFQIYLQKFYIIGGVLAGILALIGIINFFNTSATSVISRKRELTLLEIVGMTKYQVKRMLIAEGCIYLAGAFILAIIVVLTLSEKILSSTLGIAWYFEFNATIIPCIAIIPVLLLFAYIVPAYNYKNMCKESIVDRVRE